MLLCNLLFCLKLLCLPQPAWLWFSRSFKAYSEWHFNTTATFYFSFISPLAQSTLALCEESTEASAALWPRQRSVTVVLIKLSVCISLHITAWHCLYRMWSTAGPLTYTAHEFLILERLYLLFTYSSSYSSSSSFSIFIGPNKTNEIITVYCLCASGCCWKTRRSFVCEHVTACTCSVWLSQSRGSLTPLPAGIYQTS